jgi:hypothetical protein
VWKTEWKFIYAAAESKTKPNCTEIWRNIVSTGMVFGHGGRYVRRSS